MFISILRFVLDVQPFQANEPLPICHKTIRVNMITNRNQSVLVCNNLPLFIYKKQMLSLSICCLNPTISPHPPDPVPLAHMTYLANTTEYWVSRPILYAPTGSSLHQQCCYLQQTLRRCLHQGCPPSESVITQSVTSKVLGGGLNYNF